MAYNKKDYPKKSFDEKKSDYDSEVANYFIEAIQSNTAPWMKPWTANGLGLAHNPVSGTQYQGFNQIYLTLTQELLLKSDDSRWMTFLQANEKGYQVKKGSKSCTIKHWDRVPVDENGKAIKRDENGEPLSEPAKWKPHLKFFHVFNGSQIEGLEKEIAPVLDKPKIIDSAQVILDGSKVPIFHDQKDKSFYSPSKDEIHLLPHQFYKTPEYYYDTALHELAHATGHESRLNRDLKNKFGTPGYAEEELRAQIASYMICKELNLDFNPQNSVAYVQSWCKELKDKPDAIYKACYEAEGIKNFCLDFARSRDRDQVQKKAQEVDSSLSR